MPISPSGPPNLRLILSIAKTGWTTANVEHVLVKLQKIGIRDAPGLASLLRHEDGDRLNTELKRAGQKGFSRSTLEELQRQVDEFFPRVHRPPAATSAPPAGAAAARGATPGAQEVAASRGTEDAAVARDAVATAGTPEASWLLGVRSGDVVFLSSHLGMWLGIEGEGTRLQQSAALVGGSLVELAPVHVDAELVQNESWKGPDNGSLLRAEGTTKGSHQQRLLLEKLHSTGLVCSGDCVLLRAQNGKLLLPSGGLVRANSEVAGNFPGWCIENKAGRSGPIFHGDTVCLRVGSNGALLSVQSGGVHLNADSENAAGSSAELWIEKDIRLTDMPDWEERATAGWWRVSHRPSIYVHCWPNMLAEMTAAFSTDTVLAMAEYRPMEGGELWLRLRDAPEGTEQWARTTAKDCGFDVEIMELLPTQCEPPTEEVRWRHFCAVEAMHKAREQGRKAASRGDRPLSLVGASATEDMIADVFAADHAATADRSCGLATAPHSCPAAMALVGDPDAGSGFVRHLLHKGYAIIDDALSRREASQLAMEAERLDSWGLLHEPDQPTPGQRGDRIAWLNETSTKFHGSPYYSPALSSAIALLKGVADALNPALSRHHAERRAAGDLAHLAPLAYPATEEAALTVANKAMLATYPGGGARYIAHQDNMYRHALGRRGNPRELTAIIYANPRDWDAKRDGGELKIYLRSEQLVESPESKGHYEVAYVAPTGGRLVVFFSALWHEVLPAYRQRRAVTLWVYRPSME